LQLRASTLGDTEFSFADGCGHPPYILMEFRDTSAFRLMCNSSVAVAADVHGEPPGDACTRN
jgi:hypothetical protein